MAEWKEDRQQPVREKRKATLVLTDQVCITIEDFGTTVRPIIAGLHCYLGSMDGDFEQARDSLPAKALALLGQAMPILRAIVNGENEGR